MSEPTALRVHAPGRVNLIGDHTDYTGGLVFPMAIDRGTTIDFVPDPTEVALTSDDADGEVRFPVPFDGDVRSVSPHWGRYVAAMASELGATTGLRGHVSSTIPAGAGLSSSAALECAIGTALNGPAQTMAAVELAQTARRAEHRATGVPTGIMDQLCIAAARAGHATMIDCHSLEVTLAPIPDDVSIVVTFVAHRTLEGSAYAERVAECARAEEAIGPLRTAHLADVDAIADPIARRRARHVISENARVTAFAEALAAGDYGEAGRLMVASHDSLRDDFATSTPQMDAAVAEVMAKPGVFGARMTGGGFGGCIVTLCAPGAAVDGWLVTAADGAGWR